MPQNNSNAKKVIFVLCVLSSNLAMGQQQVASQAPLQVAGQTVINAAPTIAAPSQSVNTLKKMEEFQRKKMESEMRSDAEKRNQLESQMVGQVLAQAPALSSLPIPVPAKAKKSKDPTVEILANHFTMAIVLFKGIASADISYPGGVMTVKVGDLLDGWVISRITIEGVQIQKNSEYNPKTKQQKILTKVLLPLSLNPSSAASIDIPSIPGSTSKAGQVSNPDSTSIQIGGLPLPAVAPIIK